MENFKFYEVGGKIRDELLGLTSKDVDYVVVPSENLLRQEDLFGNTLTAQEMFRELKNYLESQNFTLFLIVDGCYTIRAKFPEGHKYQGIADFVMARKEVGYIPGTRTPIVEPGTLYDDLSRRDFTINAMAKDPDTGEIIDYFGGREDLKNRILKTPLDPIKTFDDDPLRILRAIRFCITKDLFMNEALYDAIHDYDYKSKMTVVSEERIREELVKCFKHNTINTLKGLDCVPKLKDYIFTHTKLWLKPTTEL